MIDLKNPVRSIRVRGFQPPWYTVFIYECDKCGKEIRIRANSFRGKNPVPGVGGIRCSCEINRNEKYSNYRMR